MVIMTASAWVRPLRGVNLDMVDWLLQLKSRTGPRGATESVTDMLVTMRRAIRRRPTSVEAR